MDFLELVEAMRDYDAARLTGFMSEPGETRIGSVNRSSERYNALLTEASGLVASVLSGKRPMWRLTEAMSTSDFPLLFGDIIERSMLGRYLAWPMVWPGIARRATVPDFRTVNRFYMDGAEARLAAVNEGAPYPAANLTEGRHQYAVSKYGRKVRFLWEAMVNDDLDALRDIPDRLAKAAARTEDYFFTTLHVDANGPHATHYTAGNSNIATSNPALSIAGLQTAFTVLAAQQDADSEPIFIDAAILEVPPALMVTAQNILNATELRLDPNASAGTENQMLVTANWMRNNVTLRINPYIPIVASSSNTNTTWFLHAAPTVGRPAMEVGFLRGHERPEIFLKAPNLLRPGGGLEPDPMMGDFDSDSIEYKVRHVLGGAFMDPKMSVSSNGSGS